MLGLAGNLFDNQSEQHIIGIGILVPLTWRKNRFFMQALPNPVHNYAITVPLMILH